MMLRSLEKSLGPFSPSSVPFFFWQRVICILRARASHRAKNAHLFLLEFLAWRFYLGYFDNFDDFGQSILKDHLTVVLSFNMEL